MQENKIRNAILIGALTLSPSLYAATSADNATDNATVLPDNTEVNQRDNQTNRLTPEDQTKGTTQDVEITRKIRAQLTSDQNLSTYAKNVKIITLGGVVTLRGPVNNQTEKDQIARVAQNVAKGKTVHNQLEVK